MEIIAPEVEAYLEELLPARDPLFVEMEELASGKDFPIIGPQVGGLLLMLARAIEARQIIELGSGFGYSALWFAKALTGGGRIIMTDFDPKYQEMAYQFFTRAGHTQLIDFRVGNALDIFTRETGPFDIVFNDIDKEEYPMVISLAHQRLRPGGFFITDNTLWYGKVADSSPDKTTRAVQEFNRRLRNHRGFMTVQLPLRDGLAVAQKV